MRQTTVRELGNRLPAGIPDSGERVTDLAFARWTAKDDREIGEWLEDNSFKQQGEVVQYVLRRFLKTFGPHALSDLPPGEAGLVLGKALTGDVLYAWILLRIQAIGPEIGFDITCPMCRGTFGFEGSLEDMDVSVPEEHDYRWTVGLRDGFEYLGKLRREIIMAPMSWSIYRDATGVKGEGAMKLRVLSNSIVGFPGHDGDVVVPESTLESLSKHDFERMSAEVGRRNIGPNMALEGRCPHCNGQWRRVLPWTYDPFFSVMASSVSPTVDRYGKSCSSSATASLASPTTSETAHGKTDATS